MRSNKKLKKGATSADWTVLIVFALLCLAVFFYFYFRFGQRLQGTTWKQICKSSVKIHAAHHFYDLNVESPLKCPTQYVTVSGKKKEEILNAVAMKMYECWDIFKEPEWNLFPQKEGETINYCVICHHITFEENMKIPVNEFLEYMETHYTPSGEKFSTYFTGISTRKGIAPLDKPLLAAGNTDISTYEIDTSIPYVTMFTFNKEGYWTKVTKTLRDSAIGTGAGAGIAVTGVILIAASPGVILVLSALVLGSAIGGTTGAIIGYTTSSWKASDWYSNIQLMPYELSQLEQMQCEYLPVSQEGGSD